ncbi:apolipoprotein D-like isoform X2 [Portunus trituberculatus]|uniref:apolipoprotein D-like isoform X2 n=1 Tax=Portunus trituberculatus TaxID=210409 RepID=UPI001E1CB8CF|nr:apolipoprotein D-like isoform X2 [Portunus trituberculatus]
MHATMKAAVAALLLAATVVLSEARTTKLGVLRDVGECPTVTTKQDFDMLSYLGSWFEIERFDALFEEGMDCVQIVYSDLGDGVFQTHNLARTVEGELTEILGTVIVLEPGVLLVESDSGVPFLHYILDTDYESFAALYNCKQFGEQRYQYAWITSRATTLDEATHDHVRKVFQDNGIDVSLFQFTYQGPDCPHTP